MNHGSDVTATSSHSSEFEEERRLKPEVKIYFLLRLNIIKVHSQELLYTYFYNN